MRAVDAARDERRARNEALFREVNERIEELSSEWPDESEQVGSLGIERRARWVARNRLRVRQGDCTELIEVTREQYEAVRSDPRRFLVISGHEHTESARVLERNSGFAVIEKLEHAAEIAVEHDPRS
jgi:hypothetical protein